MIGKGGSSRVYRVLSSLNGLYAIKRVSLDKTDSETMSGYMNEIALLKRLSGNKRIISLIDSEVKPGLQGSKGHLLLVMECGEIDLAKLLSDRTKEPLDTLWIAYYWQQVSTYVIVWPFCPLTRNIPDARSGARYPSRKDCALRPQACQLCSSSWSTQVDRLRHCQCHRERYD